MENTTTTIKTPETQDELVLRLFNNVKERQKEIKSAEEPKWLTNGMLGRNAKVNTDRVMIFTCSEAEELVDLYAFISDKEKSILAAKTELGYDAKPVHWHGKPIANWKADIKTRLNGLNLDAKKQQLAALQKRLDALITPEQRRELELAEIMKEMGEV